MGQAGAFQYRPRIVDTALHAARGVPAQPPASERLDILGDFPHRLGRQRKLRAPLTKPVPSVGSALDRRRGHPHRRRHGPQFMRPRPDPRRILNVCTVPVSRFLRRQRCPVAAHREGFLAFRVRPWCAAGLSIEERLQKQMLERGMGTAASSHDRIQPRLGRTKLHALQPVQQAAEEVPKASLQSCLIDLVPTSDQASDGQSRPVAVPKRGGGGCRRRCIEK